MQKIGILTHHYVKNYGAILQAYALMHVVQRIDPNVHVEFINHLKTSHYLLNFYRNVLKNSNIKKGYEYWKKLGKSEKALPNSKRVYFPKQIQGYDKIILGSDEIWNFKDKLAYHAIKFGYHIPCKSIYSYAPSFGQTETKDFVPQKVTDGIAHLKRVSVRDKNSQAIVEKILHKKVPIVLDPTLLYNFCEDKDFIKKPLIDREYILLYGCVLNNGQKAALIEYCQKQGLFLIGAGESVDFAENRNNYIYTPFEWMNLFYNAKYVLTGTFHGLMFSVMFKKFFVCLPKFRNRINKTKEFLTSLELADRFESNHVSPEKLLQKMVKDMNYTVAYKHLDKMREKSLQYLKEIIED